MARVSVVVDGLVGESSWGAWAMTIGVSGKDPARGTERSGRAQGSQHVVVLGGDSREKDHGAATLKPGDDLGQLEVEPVSSAEEVWPVDPVDDDVLAEEPYSSVLWSAASSGNCSRLALRATDRSASTMATATPRRRPSRGRPRPGR